MALIKVELQDTFEEWRIKINQLSAWLGDLSGINPNYSATDLVGILNEIREESKFEDYIVIEDRLADGNTKIITDASCMQFFVNNAITGDEPVTGTPILNLCANGATLSAGDFTISNGDLNFSGTTGVGNINNAANITSENITNSNHIQTKTINITSNATIGGTLTANAINVSCSSFGQNTNICGTLTVQSTTTLQNLVVSGSITSGSGNIILGPGNVTFTGCVASGIRPCTNNVYDLGTASYKWNQVYATEFVGVATSARYADLAEKYLADDVYAVGTVIAAGGKAEVTAATNENAHSVLGVISENPAFKMNSELEGGTYVALKGRVTVRVEGDVVKGDRLAASATPGVAKTNNDRFAWSFAVALEDKVGDTVEAVIL